VTAPLQAGDVAFIHRVATRRFAGDELGTVDAAAVDDAVAAAADGTAFVRAATLAAELLRRRAFSTASLQTTLLVLHCAMSLEGFSLVAPQGVLAGMVASLATEGDVASVARWLEDRAVPAASG
jgi:prophage maintenance system killer protein